MLNRIVPLAPHIVIRINPGKSRGGDFSFKSFSFQQKKITRREAMAINRLLVRSAEDTVFYRDKQDWVASFIEKNRNYRMETEKTISENGLPPRYRRSIARYDRTAGAPRADAKVE